MDMIRQNYWELEFDPCPSVGENTLSAGYEKDAGCEGDDDCNDSHSSTQVVKTLSCFCQTNITFYNENDLIDHIKESHSSEQLDQSLKYFNDFGKCSVCKEDFTNQLSNYISHILSKSCVSSIKPCSFTSTACQIWRGDSNTCSLTSDVGSQEPELLANTRLKTGLGPTQLGAQEKQNQAEASSTCIKCYQCKTEFNSSVELEMHCVEFHLAEEFRKKFDFKERTCLSCGLQFLKNRFQRIKQHLLTCEGPKLQAKKAQHDRHSRQYSSPHRSRRSYRTSRYESRSPRRRSRYSPAWNRSSSRSRRSWKSRSRSPKPNYRSKGNRNRSRSRSRSTSNSRRSTRTPYREGVSHCNRRNSSTIRTEKPRNQCSDHHKPPYNSSCFNKSFETQRGKIFPRKALTGQQLAISNGSPPDPCLNPNARLHKEVVLRSASAPPIISKKCTIKHSAETENFYYLGARIPDPRQYIRHRTCTLSPDMFNSDGNIHMSLPPPPLPDVPKLHHLPTTSVKSPLFPAGEDRLQKIQNPVGSVGTAASKASSSDSLRSMSSSYAKVASSRKPCEMAHVKFKIPKTSEKKGSDDGVKVTQVTSQPIALVQVSDEPNRTEHLSKKNSIDGETTRKVALQKKPNQTKVGNKRIPKCNHPNELWPGQSLLPNEIYQKLLDCKCGKKHESPRVTSECLHKIGRDICFLCTAIIGNTFESAREHYESAGHFEGGDIAELKVRCPFSDCPARKPFDFRRGIKSHLSQKHFPKSSHHDLPLQIIYEKIRCGIPFAIEASKVAKKEGEKRLSIKNCT